MFLVTQVGVFISIFIIINKFLKISIFMLAVSKLT